ncbi:MAG: hypothetical protein K2W95_17630 [Candidatus Obscuribacterales bacterium]|nr:hypothetical protein [Candidatus Obscuribacterales bacterium]
MEVIFMSVGAATMLTGIIQLTIQAFRVSKTWGLCCIFIPIAAWCAFTLVHSNRGRTPTWIMMVGWLIVLCGFAARPGVLENMLKTTQGL